MDVKSLSDLELIDALEEAYVDVTEGFGPAAIAAEREYPKLREETFSRMEKRSSVWVLTCEVYAPEQEGEYYLATFTDKPTKEQLSKVLDLDDLDAPVLIDHILNVGGRQGYESVWYFLREVTLHG